MYKLVVFDLDGTLVDTSALSKLAFVKTGTKMGYDGEALWPAYFRTSGLPIGERLKIVLPEIAEQIDDYLKYSVASHIEVADQCEAFDGILEMLSGIKLPTAILTSRVWITTNIVIRSKLKFQFDYILTLDLMEIYKPNPEPLWQICDRLDVKPEEVLFVGDSPHDIRCGKDAGAKTAWASWGYYPYESVREIGPDFVLGKPEDLPKVLGGRKPKAPAQS